MLAAADAELGPLPNPALVRAIVDRSKRYTSERGQLAADPAGDLAARARFFTIADAMKIAVPLGELAARDALPQRSDRPLRVLDLGAGCGAMSLGLLATLVAGTARPAIALTLIDRDRAALAVAARAIALFATRHALAVEVATTTADVTRAPLPAADLVITGTLLNELPRADALAVVERALAALPDDGALIAIEPALRDTSRALHELRDAVIARGSGHVFAPCTRRGAPCPALADPDDWCHEDRPLALPPRTAELARLTHLRDGGMKFAYLVLRRQPLDLVADPAAWRIVSAPRPAKGKLELIGCSDRGRVPLRLLRRHRNAGNRGFERADRGDVLTLTPPATEVEPRVEIDAATAVTSRD